MTLYKFTLWDLPALIVLMIEIVSLWLTVIITFKVATSYKRTLLLAIFILLSFGFEEVVRWDHNMLLQIII